MTEIAVDLRGVTKIYRTARGEVSAVKNMNVQVEAGEFFTLLGPSGCGKTTTLRLIAGFEQPTEGEVFIQGQPMGKVPPYRRPVNTVFQNYALFPHLSVGQNVGFGLSVKRVPRPERTARVADALSLVQLEGMQDRRPSQLSGGQQQRVALARALINRPTVLLLDEPLGALDLKLRKAMQIELKHLQEQVGITFIYVTHDQEEALTMSDRIAVMESGVVLQVDEPVAIYERPASRFVANFIGETNLLSASVKAVQGELALLRVYEQTVLVQAGETTLLPDQQVALTVRPEKLCLDREGDAPENALRGRVREAIYIGTDTHYLVSIGAEELLTVRLQNVGGRGLGEFQAGERVWVSWDPQDARVLLD